MKLILVLLLLQACDAHVFLQSRDIGKDIDSGYTALNATLSSLIGGFLEGRNVNDVERDDVSHGCQGSRTPSGWKASE